MINNNIQEAYCSLELSKLLKEKGFNKPCNQLYFDGELKDITVQKVSYNDTLSSRYYIAPTIAEVVMWLYEKHGVWIYTRPFSSGYFHGYIVDNSGEMKEAINTINFNSPTEAYEAAILYTLKNLIP